MPIMNKYAVIVAGGKGSRMLSDLPKQFMKLAGKPVLMHTITRFTKIQGLEVILVLPKDQVSFWKELCTKYDFESPIVVEGGMTRFHSVQNGLNAISDQEGLVAIHDGVRPFISKSIILDSFKSAKNHGSGLVVIELKDSLRQLIGANNFAQERKDFRLVQTPQSFDLRIIKNAYNVDYKDSFTDDSSVFENFGGKVYLVNGDYRNIKITTPEDLEIAEMFIKTFKYEA